MVDGVQSGKLHAMSAAHAAAMIAERSAGEMRLCASEMSMAEIAGGTSLETTTRAKSQTRSRAGRLESRFKRSLAERDARRREAAHQLKLPHSKHKRPRARSAHGVKARALARPPRLLVCQLTAFRIWEFGSEERTALG